ncbi:UPF0758 domain-containing protein [Pedobacter foliorum]|uniref:UPF0758 domain-containing protein n=1 Tax=Pedobacter foliorum TaxID=2739058 RepID=UPI0015663670|nr:UPF0758 domain-containing protein [Pedobacter foliorum]NRF37495.1 hypothetical protein [Pedobacter foliorum]
MRSEILESENFGNGKRTYFLDFARAINHRNYIKISQSDRQEDGSYKRSSVHVFEQDFYFLIEGLTALFTNMGHRESGSGTAREYAPIPKPEFKPRGIKSWPAEMRPREKYLAAGAQALSDAELLALLIGSGTAKQSAVDLAECILKSLNGDLDALCRCSAKTLSKFPGIGDTKAVTIMAAIELFKRAKQLQVPFNLKTIN